MLRCLLRTFTLSFVLFSCGHVPTGFEKQKGGYRHLPSQALYPQNLGNYSLWEEGDKKALLQDKKQNSSALYLDQKSGGEMISILYRPFAKAETIGRPKKISFKNYVDRLVQKFISRDSILEDITYRVGRNRVREIRTASEEAFMNFSFSGAGLREKLPSMTKFIFFEKDNHIIFLKTAYPSSDANTLAKPNREFVESFLKMQM